MYSDMHRIVRPSSPTSSCGSLLTNAGSSTHSGTKDSFSCWTRGGGGKCYELGQDTTQAVPHAEGRGPRTSGRRH